MESKRLIAMKIKTEGDWICRRLLEIAVMAHHMNGRTWGPCVWVDQWIGGE